MSISQLTVSPNKGLGPGRYVLRGDYKDLYHGREADGVVVTFAG